MKHFSHTNSLKEIAKGMSVLYVEDEEDIAIPFTNFLSKFFAVVNYAKNGLEAIEFYMQREYDLVITDLSMPLMNGHELISYINTINIDQKIIVISAHSESEKLIDLINIGVDSFLIKPINFENVINQLIKQCEAHFAKKILELFNRKLHESQLLLQSIFDQSKDGIALLDVETRFVFFNDAYQKMIGFDKEELLRKKCSELSVPEDNERSAEVLKKVFAQGFVENFEKTCIRKDGKKISVKMSVVLMPERQQLLVTAQDVTEAKRIEKRLSYYHELIDENIITSTSDLEGVITYASSAFIRISGYSKKELLGAKHSVVKHPDMNPEVYQELWQTISSDQIWKGELKNKNKYGEAYWVLATIYPVYDENNCKTGYTSIRIDITDKKRIEEISITDALTTLFNRRHFNEMFPKFLNSARRHNEIVCFLMIDIDFFKRYNDTYGHQRGDEVLAKVANVIKNSFNRADDLCFRLGGEEFAVLFKTLDSTKAFDFAKNLCKKVEDLQIPHEKNEASSFVTVSMGKVCFENAVSLECATLYKQADELLYQAKAMGRNQIVFREFKKG